MQFLNCDGDDDWFFILKDGELDEFYKPLNSCDPNSGLYTFAKYKARWSPVFRSYVWDKTLCHNDFLWGRKWQKINISSLFMKDVLKLFEQLTRSKITY